MLALATPGTQQRLRRLACGAGALYALHASAARAQGSAPCADARIWVDGVVAERWREPLAQFCVDLGTLSGVDPAAHVHIVPAGEDLVVEAVAGDGRRARRRVQAPEGLSFTLEALMILPEPATPQPTSTTPPPAASAAPAGPEPGSPTAPALDPAPAAAPASAKSGVEIGASLLLRVARAPTYLSSGFELYGGLRSGPWLLGLVARWEPIQAVMDYEPPPSFEMDSVAAGFVVARRVLRAESADLDLGLKTLLVTETQSIQMGAKETADTEADMRLGLLTRVLVGRPPLRWALAVELDASPLRLRREHRIAPGFPTLATWSVAVAVGGAWEES